MLYFGVFPQATVADVFIICLGGFNNAWLRPCIADITDNGILLYNSSTIEPYVKMFTQANRCRWRNINWPNNIHALESFLESEKRHVWLATVYHNQLLPMKQHFGDQLFTVAIHYSQELYPIVLENWARFNATVCLGEDSIQQRAMIDSQFINLPTQLPVNFNQLVDYFRNNVDLFRDGLPTELTTDADYVVNLLDLYSETKFFTHLKNLGTLPTEESVNYYRKWLQGQLNIDLIKNIVHGKK
jgi:hypothetical protein